MAAPSDGREMSKPSLQFLDPVLHDAHLGDDIGAAFALEQQKPNLPPTVVLTFDTFQGWHVGHQ